MPEKWENSEGSITISKSSYELGKLHGWNHACDSWGTFYHLEMEKKDASITELESKDWYKWHQELLVKHEKAKKIIAELQEEIKVAYTHGFKKNKDYMKENVELKEKIAELKEMDNWWHELARRGLRNDAGEQIHSNLPDYIESLIKENKALQSKLAELKEEVESLIEISPNKEMVFDTLYHRYKNQIKAIKHYQKENADLKDQLSKLPDCDKCKEVLAKASREGV